jgi:hypothetical protein
VIAFDRAVHRLVSQIPRGRVATYGQIAALLGAPRAARAVDGAIDAGTARQGLVGGVDDGVELGPDRRHAEEHREVDDGADHLGRGHRGAGDGLERAEGGVDAVGADDMILDIGPDTAARYAELIEQAGTVVWNGPVGVFEFDAFGRGTEVLARAIAASDAFSIAGGGDTLAAVDKYDIADEMSYISTGGGAFLEFLEGKELPAVTALKQRAV